MHRHSLKKSTLSLALGLCLGTIVALPTAHAANNDGSVVGRVVAEDGAEIAGVEVTARNVDTGLSRTVKADANGSYRFPFLPVGEYVLEVRRDGGAPATIDEVQVRLGNATNVTIPIGAQTLEAIEVTGSSAISLVDVSSVESATNLRREELTRLPVERSALAVALLAPGTAKGDAALGGVSFGGSSVAENSVYINGLNVTDFYNRIGFSAVPYAFYEEFQVKTGGYSVEFGRTTGGVINAVTRSGTNEFHAGAELVWEPDFLQDEADDQFDDDGDRYITAQYDDYDRTSLNLFASGPILRDRLFFFAMYEARDYRPRNTSNAGTTFFEGDTDDAFWGAKLDWQISDNHLLELLGFSDQNTNTVANYRFNPDTGERGVQTNTQFVESGGDNWALTYTGYLTDDLSMKAMYGENERNRATNSLNDLNCNRVFDNRAGVPTRGDNGCTNSALVEQAVDEREALRLDFEWQLGDHGLRFGLDQETNTSDYQRFYPGPDGLRYDIFVTSSSGTGSPINGVVFPPATAYVRTRALEVDGVFETTNDAWYVEDNWQATDRLMLNAGLRMEAFDNKNGEGDTYIEIDDMLAPRFGASWDVHGDGRTKLFGNLGRYFLPVANVINIKQAGGFLDERTFYLFNGYETRDFNGISYRVPILGNRIGAVDNSQGDGSVGDLRSEVDNDMDPVYQDELILGFQSMIDESWSWGVRGIYRKLHDAIDDMELTSNGVLCDGEPGYIGYIMGNPGRDATVFTDTDCDGDNDGFVTIDTSQAGWALYDDDGNYVGEIGFETPERTYKALEFQIDRAWDGVWSLNASYTLAYSRGNAEGPVNSDTNFGDSGRTENFDDPFVNLDGYGYLANDHRHQFKVRGGYALAEEWLLGATLSAQSGRPRSGFGLGNPIDGTSYHSFYICVDRCGLRPTPPGGTPTPYLPSERVYELSPRGAYGRTPWVFDLGTSIAWHREFGESDLNAKFAIYNVLNHQRVIDVDDEYEDGIGSQSPTWLRGSSFQSPRYAQLTVSYDW
jgi:hypothetical protein